MEADVTGIVLGNDRRRASQGLVVAGGLALVVLAGSFAPVAAGRVLEPGLVLVGFGTAAWWAYDNSGLAVSVALVLAPVLARLAYYWWRYLDEPAPVALPLTFAGRGAWQGWVPLAVLLGIVAFSIGVGTRRLVGLLQHGGG
jgi:hypothetical protein